MKHPLAVVWIYTLSRIAVFGAIFGLLWLFGLRGLLAAGIAVILSVPLSYVILARPRAALADSMQRRMDLRNVRTAELDAKLAGPVDPADEIDPDGDGRRPLE